MAWLAGGNGAAKGGAAFLSFVVPVVGPPQMPEAGSIKAPHPLRQALRGATSGDVARRTVLSAVVGELKDIVRGCMKLRWVVTAVDWVGAASSIVVVGVTLPASSFLLIG